MKKKILLSILSLVLLAGTFDVQGMKPPKKHKKKSHQLYQTPSPEECEQIKFEAEMVVNEILKETPLETINQDNLQRLATELFYRECVYKTIEAFYHLYNSKIFELDGELRNFIRPLSKL